MQIWLWECQSHAAHINSTEAMLILIFNNLSVNSVKALQQQIRSIIAEAVKAIADILFSTKNLTRFVQQRIWGWCWWPVQMVASDNIPDWHYTRWMLNMHFSEEGIFCRFPVLAKCCCKNGTRYFLGIWGWFTFQLSCKEWWCCKNCN